MKTDQQTLCDHIRQTMDRSQIQKTLEDAGFQVYDHETDQELIEALAQHYETEGINPHD